MSLQTGLSQKSQKTTWVDENVVKGCGNVFVARFWRLYTSFGWIYMGNEV